MASPLLGGTYRKQRGDSEGEELHPLHLRCFSRLPIKAVAVQDRERDRDRGDAEVEKSQRAQRPSLSVQLWANSTPNNLVSPHWDCSWGGSCGFARARTHALKHPQTHTSCNHRLLRALERRRRRRTDLQELSPPLNVSVFGMLGVKVMRSDFPATNPVFVAVSFGVIFSELVVRWCVKVSRGFAVSAPRCQCVRTDLRERSESPAALTPCPLSLRRFYTVPTVFTRVSVWRPFGCMCKRDSPGS